MSRTSKTYLISLAVSDYTYCDILPNVTKDSKDLHTVL